MSKVTLVLVGFLLLTEVAIAATPPTNNVSADVDAAVRSEVSAAVRDYVDAQNRGDVYAMMAMVSRRDGIISISDGQIQRGWQTIRNTNDQIVGRDAADDVTLGRIEVLVLTPTAAVAVAPFTFLAASAHGFVRVPGASSYVFEKSGRRWLVVHEHTSIATQEVAQGIE
jgi:ketosteroid isomerase-like protein